MPYFKLRLDIYFFILLELVLISSSRQTLTCTFISKNIHDSCKVYPHLNLSYEQLPAAIINNQIQPNNKNVCENNAICRKSFTISRLEYQTFSDIMHDLVATMVGRCCGRCTNLTVTKHINNIHEEDFSLENSTDIIYPVFGKSSINELYDKNFIPILHVQNAYYLTLRPSNIKVTKALIAGCLGMWPLIVICILMTFISGFIIWVMEMKANPEDFPSPFKIGVFQGFWWSFVSMTTVGYGDKAPKSIIGRLYAVLWILFGITFCSIFTATFSAELSKARTIGDAQMNGKTIGVLKNRLEDMVMVIHHGGVPYELEYNETDDGIFELLDRTIDGDISGFLLNRDTYQYFSKHIRKKHKDVEVKLRDNMMKTRVEFSGNEYSYGILMRNNVDHAYFDRYFRNNRLAIDACYKARSNNGSLELELFNAFVSDKEVFYSFLYYCLGTLGVICLLGIFYEARIYFMSNKEKTTDL